MFAAAMSRAPLRRCGGAARKKLAPIFVKVNRLDGTAELFGPAPQSAFDAARPTDRLFRPVPGRAAGTGRKGGGNASPREQRSNPDVWIIEVEDRAGRHFLDHVVA